MSLVRPKGRPRKEPRPAQGAPAALATVPLEDLFAGSGYADIPASPLQVAICRLSEGLPIGDALTSAERLLYIGSTQDVQSLPTLVALVCGVRGGKSFLAATAAIRGALRADLLQLKPYEIPRVPILAPRVDTGEATFRILVGILTSSGLLSALVVGSPTADTVVLQRPQDGRQVEITVAPASAGGLTVRNRWLAGYVLEEVAQFGAEYSGAVINVEEIQRAAHTRLLPGAQGWLISSPYGPSGLLYQTWKEHFGSPGATVVVHAPTRALNASFPQAQIDSVAARDPDTAAREYGAEWTDPDTAFYGASLVDPCVRKGPLALPREAAHEYGAAMDPATRGNAWTLVVGTTLRGGALGIAAVREWIGSKTRPLVPRVVLAEVAAVCQAYGVDTVTTDQWSGDSLRDVAETVGLTLRVESTTAAQKLEDAQDFRTRLADRKVELPPVPQVRQDLLALRKRLTTGAVTVHLPTTADGRHCDYVPALWSLARQHLAEPPPLESPEDRARREEAAVFAGILAVERGETEWWE